MQGRPPQNAFNHGTSNQFAAFENKNAANLKATGKYVNTGNTAAGFGQAGPSIGGTPGSTPLAGGQPGGLAATS